jgi:ubiquinone/menaquinone biosynthesis C-methylase UbiE
MTAQAFDTTAAEFDRHRALPHGVAEEIRAAVLRAAGTTHPLVLDLGAGSGRFGWPFVTAGDRYLGVDVSYGMLHEFAQRVESPKLAQCDGESLPFRDESFDVVMLMHVVGGARGWRRLLAEARRVMRENGVLMIGKSAAPDDGMDALLKARLKSILEELGVPADQKQGAKALAWLESVASEKQVVAAASWTSERSARGFLDRKATGAKFVELPVTVREEALRRLTRWATDTFGSLDSVRPERYTFELTIFRFALPSS